MIVATTLTEVPDGTRRLLFYRCQDHLGAWHDLPAVFCHDLLFDTESHKSVIAEKMERKLAESEFEDLIR